MPLAQSNSNTKNTQNKESFVVEIQIFSDYLHRYFLWKINPQQKHYYSGWHGFCLLTQICYNKSHHKITLLYLGYFVIFKCLICRCLSALLKLIENRYFYFEYVIKSHGISVSGVSLFQVQTWSIAVAWNILCLVSFAVWHTKHVQYLRWILCCFWKTQLWSMMIMKRKICNTLNIYQAEELLFMLQTEVLQLHLLAGFLQPRYHKLVPNGEREVKCSHDWTILFLTLILTQYYYWADICPPTKLESNSSHQLFRVWHFGKISCQE